MQYILTQEELDELRRKRSFEIRESKGKLQKLCSKICDTWIVEEGWYKGKVWGCILTKNKNEEWYCDSCIVQDICPCDHKTYSQ